jgi:hypothetical protein
LIELYEVTARVLEDGDRDRSRLRGLHPEHHVQLRESLELFLNIFNGERRQR